MKRFVLAIALACALSATTLAGEVPTTGAPLPGQLNTPGAPAPTNPNPDPGDMGSGGAALLIILDLLF